jgi:hypothetical protein
LRPHGYDIDLRQVVERWCKREDELTKRAVDLIILAIVAVAGGLLNRWLDRERRKGATARSPLWDADIDNPTPG